MLTRLRTEQLEVLAEKIMCWLPMPDDGTRNETKTYYTAMRDQLTFTWYNDDMGMWVNRVWLVQERGSEAIRLLLNIPDWKVPPTGLNDAEFCMSICNQAFDHLDRLDANNG